MKRLPILLLTIFTLAVFAKSPKDDKCDLSKVTFTLTTKQVKSGAKIKDTYQIVVNNATGAGIKVTAIISPRATKDNADPKIKKEVTMDKASTKKTIGGSVETGKGLESADITVELTDPGKCEKKTLTLNNQKFIVQ